MCPFFYSFFFIFFIDLLSWTEFQHADDPYLGYFWKKFSIFQAQRGCNGILLMFQDKQTCPYIILNYDCLIFREINSRNRFQRFQILVIFLFLPSSYLLLRLPFAGFQSNGLLFFFIFFLFFLIWFFLNAFSEKNLKFVAAWKIWLIAPIWCLLLVLMGNKHVTEANHFLFWGGRLKGVSNTRMPICHYERNQNFFMPSFKIASNLFIIFINKFNDSINMIHCAIFIIFIPRHPSNLEKIL